MNKIISNFKFQFRLSVAAFIFSLLAVLLFSEDKNVFFTLVLMLMVGILCLLPALELYRQTKKLEEYHAILQTFSTIIKNCQNTIRYYLEPGSIIPASETLDRLIKSLDNQNIISIQNQLDSL